MRAVNHGSRRRPALLGQVILAGGLLLAAFAANAADTWSDHTKALRVCQDPNNPPFSTDKPDGFEVKIAQLIAADMKLPLEFKWFPQRFGFVRKTLKDRVPNKTASGYSCDLIIGAPVGADMMTTTRPYYRSTYVMLIPKDSPLAGIKTPDDIVAWDADRVGKLRIGYFDRSPATDWLQRHGLFNEGKLYKLLNGDPKEFAGEIIKGDLVNHKIDALIIWGPIAGYYSQQLKDHPMEMLPMQSERNIKFQYDIGMGVRYGEPNWKAKVQAAIDRNQDKIYQILTEYNIPYLKPEMTAQEKR